MASDDEIFEQLLGAANLAEREALLAGFCKGNEARRLRLEALLRAHDRAEMRDFMSLLSPSAEQAPTAPVETPGAPAGSAVCGEVAGDEIGPYRLEEELGSGGFGSVWKAEQKRPVRRVVALKILKPGMDTKEVITRFEQERQALALMDHPHIARVLDAGATPAGRPFFVMELVRGTPVTTFCDRNRLTLRQRLELLAAICRAVQHAHQKGIIHRDLKPSNILVSWQDGQPVPRVIDFGIAKAVTGRLTDDSHFATRQEQLIGTPAYMSPEQAAGELDIDTRSDIYSLGVLLYEVLAGRPPFDTASLLRHGVGEMCRILQEREPQRPSTAVSNLNNQDIEAAASARQTDARQLPAQLRGDLDWIILKALSKDRRRRYDSASDLAADLERHLNHEPVLARPPSLRYRAGRWVRRNRAVFISTCLLFVALVGGLAVSVFLLVQLRQEEALRRETERRRALERLSQMLSTGDDMRIGDALEVAAVAGIEPPVLELFRAQRDLLAGRMAEASARLAPLVAREDAGLIPLSLHTTAAILDWRWSDYERGLARVRPLEPRTRQEFLFKGQALAHTEPEAGIPLMRRALEMEPSSIAYVLLADAQTTLATGSGKMEDIQAAIESIDTARKLSSENVGILSISTWAHAVGAALAREQGRAELAAAWEKQAQAHGDRLERYFPNPFAISYRALQLDLGGQSQASFALLEAQWRAHPHPSLLRLYTEALMLQGRPKEVLAVLQAHPAAGDALDSARALALLEVAGGPSAALAGLDTPAATAGHGMIMRLFSKPALLLLAGRPEEARRQALANYEGRPPGYDTALRPHYAHMARCLAGLMPEAELLQQCAASRWDLCEAHSLLGMRCLAEGRRPEARAHFEKATATRAFKSLWFTAARVLLQRLEKDPAWPPWIPPAR